MTSLTLEYLFFKVIFITCTEVKEDVFKNYGNQLLWTYPLSPCLPSCPGPTPCHHIFPAALDLPLSPPHVLPAALDLLPVPSLPTPFNLETAYAISAIIFLGEMLTSSLGIVPFSLVCWLPQSRHLLYVEA